MKKILLTALCTSLLWGCTSETEMIDTPESVGQSESYRITMDEIQQLALSLPEIYGKNEATRAGKKMIREVYPLADHYLEATRSGSVDAGVLDDIYVIDYEDNQGFAIIPSDTRLGSFLAYSDQGNLEENLEGNIGVKMMIDAIPEYVSTMMDSINHSDNGLGGVTRGALQGQVIRGPFIPVTYNQGYPYNAYTPAICGGKIPNTPVGSAAVAMMHVMRYYGQPASYTYSDGKKYNIDWGKIDNKIPGQFNFEGSRLLRHIGLKVKVAYACDSRLEASLDKVKDGLGSLGYKSDQYVDYDFNKVKLDLDNRRPVMARGVDNPTDYKLVWVIDGYSKNGSSYQFHINWGGEGGNGYYTAGLFNPGLNYSKNIRIIRNVRPK